MAESWKCLIHCLCCPDTQLWVIYQHWVEIKLILSGKNYCHKIKKNHDSLFFFSFGASTLIHLWFIAPYHWEIVPIHVKCQKHSSPSIKSYQGSVEAICIRETRCSVAQRHHGIPIISRWKVVSACFFLWLIPRLLLWRCIDRMTDLMVWFLLLYHLFALECSQGVCRANAFVDLETRLKISFLYSFYYLL